MPVTIGGGLDADYGDRSRVVAEIGIGRCRADARRVVDQGPVRYRTVDRGDERDRCRRSTSEGREADGPVVSGAAAHASAARRAGDECYGRGKVVRDDNVSRCRGMQVSYVERISDVRARQRGIGTRCDDDRQVGRDQLQVSRIVELLHRFAGVDSIFELEAVLKIELEIGPVKEPGQCRLESVSIDISAHPGSDHVAVAVPVEGVLPGPLLMARPPRHFQKAVSAPSPTPALSFRSGFHQIRQGRP